MEINGFVTPFECVMLSHLNKIGKDICVVFIVPTFIYQKIQNMNAPPFPFDVIYYYVITQTKSIEISCVLLL